MLGAVAGLSRQLAAGYAVARHDLAEPYGKPRHSAAPPVVAHVGRRRRHGRLGDRRRPRACQPAGADGALRRGARLRAACLGRAVHPGRRGQLLGQHRGDARLRRDGARTGLHAGCASPQAAAWRRSPRSAVCRSSPCRPACSRGRRSAISRCRCSQRSSGSSSSAAVEKDVEEAAALLRDDGRRSTPAHRRRRLQPGQGPRARLYGRVPLVYGAGLSAPAARRWKTQLNENAKTRAFWAELPELDHNEIEAWGGLSREVRRAGRRRRSFSTMVRTASGCCGARC